MYLAKSIQQKGGLLADSAATLKRGDQGTVVKSLQQKLGLAADGIFGPRTELAVKKFQAANGLAADGIVGPNTWAALNSGTATFPKQGSINLPAPIQKTVDKTKETWLGLSSTEKWMYGVGGTALIIGLGMALSNGK